VTIDVSVSCNILLPIRAAQLLLVTTQSLLMANGVLSVYDPFKARMAHWNILHTYCTLCIIVSLRHPWKHVEYPSYYGKLFSPPSKMIFHWSKRRKM